MSQGAEPEAATGQARDRPAVFLDRDGVVNHRRLTLVRKPKHLRLHAGVPEAVGRLNQAGYLVVVVTNQAPVGYGIIREDDLTAIHDTIQARLQAHGARVDAIYACPHKKSEGCTCAKPKPGMLEEAADELGIDPGASWMVGDKPSDVKAGKAFGARTIQVTGDHFPWDRWRQDPGAEARVEDLAAAVEVILERDGRA